jgi:hypothetical protein
MGPHVPSIGLKQPVVKGVGNVLLKAHPPYPVESSALLILMPINTYNTENCSFS